MANNEVARVENISHEEFMENYYRPGIPVVFKNASKSWKANSVFSPNWFRANFGDRILKKGDREYRMSEIFDLVENSTKQTLHHTHLYTIFPMHCQNWYPCWNL